MQVPSEERFRIYKNAFIIAIIYLTFGILWIYFSDSLVEILAKNNSTVLSTLQTYKGLFFILITTVLLFILSYKFLSKQLADYICHLDEQESTQILLKSEKQRADYAAHYDMLTGLPNELSLFEYTKKRCSQDSSFAFMLLDLDEFKEINDSYGHNFGDRLLIEIALLLKKNFSSDSFIVRTGGDEFVIILTFHEDKTFIHSSLDRLTTLLNNALCIDGTDVYITASIGIATYPKDANNYEELLQKSDTAMFNAKKIGKNTYSFYNATMTEKALYRTKITTNLKKALLSEELIVFFQPQVDSKSKEIIGVEALLRWISNEESIPPSVFIPIAEESSLILEIGRFVFKECFKLAKEWSDAGCLKGRIAVNVSARQFIHPNFLKDLETILEQTNCNPKWIELEITESSILENPQRTINLIGELRKKGFHISMDDFGTGYSSMSYLKNLPINKLKIDQSFIRDITNEPKNQIIVKIIISLAKGLGIEVLAEGVETVEELDFLNLCGIDSIQGYYYHKPMPLKDIETLLK